ncbi:hypothetical protein LEP1GSC126_2899 [Leptospira kirschneri str. 200801774]|nr:hypothetical protein LEP1GSC126_2899 [Leptospira kirschneri str. 200801774]
MKTETCAKCGKRTRFIFQGNLCRKCLAPALQRGTKIINEVQPLFFIRSKTESPEDAV